MTSDGKMRAVAVDSVAGEVEVALAIPCFILCAMCPQMRNLTSIEDVLLSFSHDTAPFCGIERVQTHPDRGLFEFGEKGLRRDWRTYGLRGRDYGRRELILK